MKLRFLWIAFMMCFLIFCPIVSAQKPVTLRLSLYELVPDQDRFVTAIGNEWNKRHPDIPLEFVDWDCYSGELPDDLDVFVYDAIFFYPFLEQGRLLPLTADEIENREDLFAYALDAAAVDGRFYGIPQMLCSDFLFTRKDDTEMAEIDSIPELYEVLGKVDANKAFPSENEGLLINITDDAAMNIMYIQALADAEQTVDRAELFPIDPDHLSAEAVDSITMIRDMAGIAQMPWTPEDSSLPFNSGKAFMEGIGRAYINVSESMARMGDEAQNMDVRLFSMTDDNDIPLFFADYASVSANISEDKKDLAIELVNVITGTEVMVNALSPAVSGQTYQYLLPARKSVFDAVSETDQLYAQFRDIVTNSDIRLYFIPYDVFIPLYETQIIKALLTE